MRYWCALERYIVLHVKKEFKLSFSGEPKLYVDQQKFTAFEGGSVTVSCRHNFNDQKVQKWCRLGSSCVQSSGSIGKTTVTIDASHPKVFTVTMSGLKTESSGCSTMVTIVSTTLVLLLLIIPAAFFGWKMIMKRKKPESKGPDMTVGPQFGSDPDVHYATIAHNQDITAQVKGPQFGSDPDVHYATIAHNQHITAQVKTDIPEETVTYSTIVTKNSAQQMTEPAEGSVIYSTVLPKQNKC
ncbi:uncharacterized protein LOC131993049 [Centropristis striata]|uniref:uncharacterized protein LOC131993049 n=1 Tax=Centropristis striata TaxID=184440 RepID=UPI0027DF1E2C|nr:uncharacterized protein LOC131993049 [Centropristis striata]